ncbi:unnamed protein product, partial [Sphacelaria rigidula]
MLYAVGGTSPAFVAVVHQSHCWAGLPNPQGLISLAEAGRSEFLERSAERSCRPYAVPAIKKRQRIRQRSPLGMFSELLPQPAVIAGSVEQRTGRKWG